MANPRVRPFQKLRCRDSVPSGVEAEAGILSGGSWVTNNGVLIELLC